MSVFLRSKVQLCTLHIDVYPEKVNELVDNEVNITCYLSEASNWDGNVITVELGKKGEHPIATLGTSTLNYGPDRKMNVKAEGRIVNNSTQSFLRLTISDPETGDAGTYSCSVYYTDGFGVMQQGKVEAHVTVDNDNTKAELVHLLNKMSDLEKTVETQDKVLKEHDAQTKGFKKELQDQQDNIKLLENTLAQQNKKLKDQQDKMNAVEKELKEQQEKQLKDQCANDTVMIAFSYAYNTNDKLVEGQPMLFRNKIMSIGDAYDPKSGVFTAPRDGLYVFHLHVMTYNKNDKILIDLQANGKVFDRLFVRDIDGHDQSSVSSVTSLKAGDHVRPLLYLTTYNYAFEGDYSTFSGYLLELE